MLLARLNLADRYKFHAHTCPAKCGTIKCNAHSGYKRVKVSLFVTCVVDQVFPQVGIAMAEVLERLGYDLDFPQVQTCCGQPAFNSGYPEEARTVARHFVDVFRDSEYV